MPGDNGIDAPDLHIRDRRALWRAIFWGGSTAFALVAATLIATSDFGTQRLHQALASIIEPGTAVAIPSPQKLAQTEQQIRQLGETVQTLAGDRDRLLARVATLEETLQDVTGSVKRQADRLAAQEIAQKNAHAGAAATTAATTAAAGAAPPPTLAASTPPPSISAPATTVATIVPTEPAAKPTSAPAITGAVPASSEAAASGVPLPPSRGNAVPEPATEQMPTIVKNEIGVDVGGAPTMEGLRAHWAAVKANHGPLLAGLRPMVVVRVKKPAGADYRLVLGPLANAAAAARLCAQFVLARGTCRAGVFSGQILAMR